MCTSGCQICSATQGYYPCSKGVYKNSCRYTSWFLLAPPLLLLLCHCLARVQVSVTLALGLPTHHGATLLVRRDSPHHCRIHTLSQRIPCQCLTSVDDSDRHDCRTGAQLPYRRPVRVRCVLPRYGDCFLVVWRCVLSLTRFVLPLISQIMSILGCCFVGVAGV